MESRSRAKAKGRENLIVRCVLIRLWFPGSKSVVAMPLKCHRDYLHLTASTDVVE
jgi:hypothetical protein